MTAPADYWVCVYCGTMGLPITLQRSPEAKVKTPPVSDRRDEHATDCPLYAPTVQPVRIG